jgi:cysteinyl-tRNA synthetase, unknown class
MKNRFKNFALLFSLFCFPTSLGKVLGNDRINAWVYQLQSLDLERLKPLSFDLLVTDYSRDGGEEQELTVDEVRSLKQNPNGEKRKVLAYFSIGEAEDYRFYWKKSWKDQPPDWVERENPNWAGNFRVQYWNPQWQDILLSYLERIIKAEFDGAYLDLVDAFETLESRYSDARPEMIALVCKIHQYAQVRKTGFIIFAQNGESLGHNSSYLNCIDGISREDLYFGIGGDGIPNESLEILEGEQNLLNFLQAGKSVLLVEYGLNAKMRQKICDLSKKHGYLPSFAVRKLDDVLPRFSCAKPRDQERLPRDNDRNPKPQLK